jgi:TonB family protein
MGTAPQLVKERARDNDGHGKFLRNCGDGGVSFAAVTDRLDQQVTDRGRRPGWLGKPGRVDRRVGARATGPDAIPGIGSVRGSLDKEIIRRIVRRHLNEVRYCYEQALAAHPSLTGRLVVQFTIAPTGLVLASVLQSSSLGVVSVDICVVQAVKRWEFPQPKGGGLVMVSYPFQLTPGS